MTFMDDVHRDNEKASYVSVRQLQLWLSTLAPIEGSKSLRALSMLENICDDMEWEMEWDEQLERSILK